MKVERRLPFGFRGDWGTVYKRYTGECTINTKNNQITYEKNNYVDIGVAVQFKAVEDMTKSNIKIEHLFFTELVDQCVQYLLSGKK